MQVPICGFDAKNEILCPGCELKLETGELTKADVKGSFILAKLAKSNPEISGFSLSKCCEIDGNYILFLKKEDIITIRKSRVLYRLIQEKFSGKIWIVEYQDNVKKFIEDLFFPTRILSINSVWAPDGKQKTKAIVSGHWTPRFPISLDNVIKIVKNARNLDIEIEFEKTRK